MNEITEPVPEPRPGEDERAFISRCISTLHKTDPERPDDQITAMCYTKWREDEQRAPVPDKCYCRECGHVLENPTEHCDQVPCPECDAERMYRRASPTEYVEGVDYVHDVLDERDFNPVAAWPDSCFAYVPASAKGPDGRKSDRKFPYRWPSGEVSCPNVRNALARLGRADIPSADKSRIKTMMQRLMKKCSPDYEPTEASMQEDLNSIQETGGSLHDHFKKILGNFQRYWGRLQGLKMFDIFIKKNSLDPTKAYAVAVQFAECVGGVCEAFHWVEPLIQFYKEDESTGARYYKVLALTANISMNDNDYEDAEQLALSAPTLSWRPLNYNHDHSRWLPFDENRVDLAAFEDNGVESVMRILDEEALDKLAYLDKGEEPRDGDIIAVSIEGKPRGSKQTDGGRAPIFYNYTALGLLEKGSSLPGDPVTTLEPLFVSESIGRSLVESLREETHVDETILEASGAGAQGIQICGMCRFFEDLTNTTVKNPAVTGADTDAFVTITQGGIVPGGGVCLVLNRAGQPSLVRKADAACTDGRLRDAPTDVVDAGGIDRTTEMLHEVELLKQRADLTEMNQDLAKQVDDRTAELSSTKEKLTKALDKIKKLTKESASFNKNRTALQKDLDDTREERDKTQDKTRNLEVTIERRDEDIKALREKATRIEEDLDKLNVKATRLKEDLAASRRQTADESEKRASSNEKAQNLALEAARLRDELADVTEQVAKLTREVYEGAKIRAEQAKRMVSLEKENGELKKKVDNLSSQIKEAQRKMKQAQKKLIIKL